jgi:Zn-dependent membrane protease YugP
MLVPAAQIGSNLAFPLFFIGLIFRTGFLMDAGLILFGAAVVFTLITLPVEYNASGRAVALLESGGYIDSTELPMVKSVLDAAALTYVAAAAMAIGQFLRLLALRNRRD